MSSPSFKIITDGLSVDDAIVQLRAIQEFPCMITICGRTFKLCTSDECWALIIGMEVSVDVVLDLQEKQAKV